MGEAAELLASFGHASSVVSSRDGKTLFVGDRDGGIFAIVEVSGESTVLVGTQTIGVSHLDLDGGSLVLAGTDANGVHGVWTIPVAGGALTEVEAGLAGAPSGVLALGAGGYIVAHGSGLIERIGAPGSDALLDGITVGVPTGMVISADGATLMISSLSARGTAQLVLQPLDGKEATVFDDGIGQNTAAGGLRCTPYGAVCAWSDSGRRPAGGVYRVTPLND